MPTPSWLGATAGQPAQAGQVNQFLGTHQITYLYTGTVQWSHGAGTGTVNSNGAYYSHAFTTGTAQTKVGYVLMSIAVTGSPSPLQVSIYADLSGSATGSPLAITQVPREFLTGTASTQPIPLPCIVTPSTVYHVVVAPAGDASNFYTLSKSDQGGGTQTSTDGVTWTSQSYGLVLSVYDQATVPPLKCIYEDAGARWSALTYTGSQLAAIEEYTAGQTVTGYTASSRNLSYSGTYLTGVA